MNRKEYLNNKQKHNNHYKLVQKLLKEWKLANNITERCDVHHRDDTDECRKYNDAHYELWGCEEDGTFEYGKYVVFMTAADHARYHHIGNKNPMYGKPRPEEVKSKLSALFKGENNPFYGKHHTDEVHAKIIAAHRGKPLTDEHKAKISAVLRGKKKSEETKTRMHEHMSMTKALYAEHKNNGGTLSWNEFQKHLKEAANENTNNA